MTADLASSPPSAASLRQLATSSDVQDRAFAASALLLERGAETRPETAEIYASIRHTALSAHAALRERLRAGRVERRELFDHLEQAPLELRDHLLEEILGIAYPPLDALPVPFDITRHAPSGIAELSFLLDHTELGPGKTFLDLGSGLGKVVMMVALLTGASCHGIELDPRLATQASEAAAGLGLQRVQIATGDIRRAPLPRADAAYMFIPFLRSGEVAPTEVVTRLRPRAPSERLRLFCQALDLRELSWLKAKGQSQYWLNVYESVP